MQAVAMLRDFRKRSCTLADDAFVFSPAAHHGRPYFPESISQMFYRVACDAGMPYRFHSLRPFAATQEVAAGFNPVAVASLLGHADPSVTLRIYSHAVEGRDRALAETLGAVVETKAIFPKMR